MSLDCSIIIPIYEQNDLLPFVITSLIAQETQSRFEVIVCDDGSSTCPLPMVTSLCGSIPFEFRYVWQPHLGRGVARSRNNGIRLARGEILIFVDGDSLLPPTFIDSHLSFHASRRNTLYCGTRRLVFVNTEGRETLSQYKVPAQLLEKFGTSQLIDFHKWQQRVLRKEPWRACMGCNMSLRKNPEVRFDEGFLGWGFEDIELAYRLLNEGCAISIEPPTVVYSIEFGGQTSYSPVRPRTSVEIEAFLRDLFRFETLHAHADLTAFFRMCRLFYRDKSQERWIRLRDSVIQTRDLDKAIADARSWAGGC